MTEVAGQCFEHKYLASVNCPVNLMGRDILVKCGATVDCSADGLQVTFPNGHVLNCSSGPSDRHQLWLAPSSDPTQDQWADIYWGLLEPATPEQRGICGLFQQWKPWLSLFQPYIDPPDPFHVTLYYDRDQDFIYQEAFQEQVADATWHISTPELFIGPEGVAAFVQLAPGLLQWYKMADTAEPHVTLLIHANHQAKDLGPMVKRLRAVTDWVDTQIPALKYSASSLSYKIMHHTTDVITLEHQCISRDHGRERTDHPDTENMLNSLPSTLWFQGTTDVGHCLKIPPVTFQIEADSPIWQAQYRHKPEADEGISATIEGLLEAGVLEPSHSAWNTPILPVPKADSGKYRMAHDLRRINRLVTTPQVAVPNPYMALSTLTPEHKYFTCIDLANAFFCLPLAEDLRPIFSFTYRDRQLQYTRLPQGFILSPGLFNQALRSILQDVELPQGTVLVQYVDDILIASPDTQSCLQTTHQVLQALDTAGFKVSKNKLQCCRPVVSFLGRLVSGKGQDISPSHKTSILNHPRPSTVKEMLSFLGLTGYSRQFIPDYAGLTTPLRQLVNEQGMRNLAARLEWTMDAEKAFIDLKAALAKATSLAIPDYQTPFFLDVSERPHAMHGVLFQKKGVVERY